MKLDRSLHVRWLFTILAILASGAAACAAPVALPVTGPAATTATVTATTIPSAPTATVPPKATTAPAATPTAAAGAVPKPLEPAVTVKYADLGNISDAAVYIALEKGYFKAEGINLELVRFGGAAEVVPALAAEQIDIGGSGISPSFFNSVKRGIPLKVVADKGRFSKGGGFTVLLARKDLVDSGKLKGPGDLKGMKIGVSPTRNVINEMVIERILVKAGLTLADVEVIPHGIPDTAVVLANKAVDADAALEPTATQAIKQGVGVRWVTADEVALDFQAGVIMFSPKFAERQPEAAKRFAAAYVRGARDYNDAFFKNNKGRAEIVGMLTKNTTVKDATTYDSMIMAGLNPDGYVNAPTIKETYEWFVSKGAADAGLDLTKVIDNQYVDHALGRLGKYQ